MNILRFSAATATLFIIFFIFTSNLAKASNTSGVHGPRVDAGERGMDFRFAMSPSDFDGQADAWAYRMHYQHALSDKVRARVVVQYRDQGDLQYDYFRGEVLYNFKKQEDGIWSSGMRFDLRTRRGERPEDFTLSWTNQWSLGNGIRLRGLLIGSRQFGSSLAAAGVSFATRASISKKLDNHLSFGLEIFNDYGRLGEFGSFNSQSHQIGPMLGGTIGGLKYEVRYLAGVSNGSRDHSFGLRFNRSF
jgi:hypothetical protein